MAVFEDITPPALTGTPAAAVDVRTVNFTWAPATDDSGMIGGYFFRCGQSRTLSGNGTLLAGNSYTLTDLADGTYYYQIRAFDAAGRYSDWSPVASFAVAGPIRGDDQETISRPDVAVGGSIGYGGNYQDLFAMNLETPGMYEIVGDFGTLNGSIAILNGKKTIASGTVKNGVLVFNKGKSVLLPGKIALSVVVKNSDRGKSASEYSFHLSALKLFENGDNTDDWTDLRTMGTAGLPDSALGHKVEKTGDMPVADGWVGYGDAVDYLEITLESAARLSFNVAAEDAAKFSICRLVESKSGTFSLKTLQSTVLKAPRGTSDYAASTKNLLLTAGNYYLRMDSTNAAKGGDAGYSIQVAESGKFFVRGDMSDDWTDLRTLGAAGLPDSALGHKIDKAGEMPVADGWVGYGDTVDYLGITLESAARLSFNVAAEDAAKFSICRLVESKSGTFSLKTLQSTVLKAPRGTSDYAASTKNLLLTAGNYYLRMDSTNAAKGGDAGYSIQVAESCRFFPAADASDNSWRQVTGAEVHGVDSALSGWVGFGDASDYFRLELEERGRVVLAPDDDTVEAYQNRELSIRCLDARGKSVAMTWDALSSTLQSRNELDSGTYYVGVGCTNVGKFDTEYKLRVDLLA